MAVSDIYEDMGFIHIKQIIEEERIMTNEYNYYVATKVIRCLYNLPRHKEAMEISRLVNMIESGDKDGLDYYMDMLSREIGNPYSTSAIYALADCM